MTDSYNQGDINLLEGSPISVQTPDATPLVVQLGSVRNGATLTIFMSGGGSDADPLLVSTNNYAVFTANTTFTRVGAIGAVSPASTDIDVTGLAVVLSFQITDGPILSSCELVITGPATPYNHRFKYAGILF